MIHSGKFIKTITLLFLAQFALAGSSYGKTKRGTRGGDSKSLNLKTSPFSLALGVPNIGVEVQTSKEIAVGGHLAHVQTSGFGETVSATGIDGKAGYHFNGVFKDSPYVRGSLGYLVIASGSENSGDAISIQSAMGGYRWVWDQFNIDLGMVFNPRLLA